MRSLLKFIGIVCLIFFLVCLFYYIYVTIFIKSYFIFIQLYDSLYSLFSYSINYLFILFNKFDFLSFHNLTKYIYIKIRYFHIKNQVLFMGYNDTFFFNNNYFCNFTFKHKYWFYVKKRLTFNIGVKYINVFFPYDNLFFPYRLNHFIGLSYSKNLFFNSYHCSTFRFGLPYTYTFFDFNQSIINSYKIFINIYKQLGIIDLSEFPHRIFRRFTIRYRIRQYGASWSQAYLLLYRPSIVFFSDFIKISFFEVFVKYFNVLLSTFVFITNLNYLYVIIFYSFLNLVLIRLGYFNLFLKGRFIKISYKKLFFYINLLLVCSLILFHSSYFHFIVWFIVLYLFLYLGFFLNKVLFGYFTGKLRILIFFLLFNFKVILSNIYIPVKSYIFRYMKHKSLFVKFNKWKKKKLKLKKNRKLYTKFYKIYKYILYYFYIRCYLFKVYFYSNTKLYYVSRTKSIYYPDSFWVNFRVYSSYLPKYYTYYFIPNLLFLSSGGLWLRSYNREFSKLVFFENKDYLRFIQFSDAAKNYIWEPYSSYTLHLLDFKTEFISKRDLFWSRYFSGFKTVFSKDSINKYEISSYITHYEDILVVGWFLGMVFVSRTNRMFTILNKITYVINPIFYIFIKPVIIDFYLTFKQILISRWNLIFVGFSSFFKEFYLFKNDPVYLPYIRTISFYNLSGYKYVDLYSKYNSMVFAFQPRKYYQDLNFVSNDKWLLDIRVYEYTDSGYLASAGHIFDFLLYLVLIISLKLTRLTYQMYNRFHVAYLWFVFGSFIYNIWFFSAILDGLASILNDRVNYNWKSMWHFRSYKYKKMELDYRKVLWDIPAHNRWARDAESRLYFFRTRIRRGKFYKHTRNYNFDEYI